MTENERGERVALAGSAVPAAALEGLKNEGFGITVLPPDPRLPAPVAGHADLSLFLAGGFMAARRDYARLLPPGTLERLAAGSGRRLVLSDETAAGAYPGDTGLCCAVSEDYVVLREKSADPEVLKYALENGLRLINVKQGYAACSTAVLSDGAAITDDEGIYRALVSASVSCLLISRGSVLLPGYGRPGEKEGFFGGCCGVTGGVLYTIGNAGTHPDYGKISAFLTEHHTVLRPLCDGELFDAGKILFL